MKKISMLTAGAFAVLLLCSAIIIRRNTIANKPTDISVGQGFAVLELFTSEGCSSCPPADELVAKLQKEAGDKPVYVLAYHVDYWDRQGWRDIFSSPAFSKRQYQYQRQFTSSVYTPQLILNGKSEFVGSDEREIRSALAEVVKGTPATTLVLTAKQQAGKMNITYQVKGMPVKVELLIALVQKHAVNRIKAGENKGRTLVHAQIVHSLNSFKIDAAGPGTVQVALPAGFNIQEWEIIGLLQNYATGKVAAAARASYPVI